MAMMTMKLMMVVKFDDFAHIIKKEVPARKKIIKYQTKGVSASNHYCCLKAMGKWCSGKLLGN